MSGLSSSGVYIASPRRKFRFSGGDAASFSSYLATLPGDETTLVQLDGIVSLDTNVYIQKPVIIEPLTKGSGFSWDGGYLYMGLTDSGWTTSTRGTALAVNVVGGSNSFTIPGGFTLAEGDYVVLSSNDIMTNCAFPYASNTGLKIAERHRVEAIIGSIAYTARPIESSMTTANAASVLNYTAVLDKPIQLNGLSFYYTDTPNGGSIEIKCLNPIIRDCTWEDPCPGPIRFLDNGDGEISGCSWKKGMYSGEYGIIVKSYNNMRVANNTFRGNVYHWCVTSDGGTVSNYTYPDSGALIIEGNNINSTCRVSGTNRMIDLHGESYNSIIRNNVITLTGILGVSAPSCVASRSRSPIFEGNTFNLTNQSTNNSFSWAIQCYGGGNRIINNIFNGGDHAVYIDEYYQNGTLPETTIHGNTFDRTGTSAIVITNGSPIKGVNISNNVFTRNVGTSYSGRPASCVDIDVSSSNILFVNINGNTMNRSVSATTSTITNLVLRSTEFSNTGVWIGDASGVGAVAPTVTANYAYGPDGNATADRLQFDKGVGAGFSRLQQAVTTTASANYTFSVWMKTNDYTVKSVALRLDSTGSTGTVTPEWKRFYVSTAVSGTSTQGQILLYDSLSTSNTADISVWGAQFESGTSAHTYVPTTSASAATTEESTLHASIDSDLTPEIIRITGNQFFGYGSGIMGFGGATGSIMYTKYSKDNYGDY